MNKIKITGIIFAILIIIFIIYLVLVGIYTPFGEYSLPCSQTMNISCDYVRAFPESWSQ